MYQPNSEPVAAGRTHPEVQAAAAVPAAPAAPAVRLTVGLALIARRLVTGVPKLPEPDRQFLWDLAREEARYPMRALQRLIEIARQAQRDEDAEELAELFRAEIRAGRAHDVDWLRAFDEETDAQAETDRAQFRFAVERTPGTLVALRRAALRQLAKTRQLLDTTARLTLPTL